MTHFTISIPLPFAGRQHLRALRALHQILDSGECADFTDAPEHDDDAHTALRAWAKARGISEEEFRHHAWVLGQYGGDGTWDLIDTDQGCTVEYEENGGMNSLLEAVLTTIRLHNPEAVVPVTWADDDDGGVGGAAIISAEGIENEPDWLEARVAMSPDGRYHMREGRPPATGYAPGPRDA